LAVARLVSGAAGYTLVGSIGQHPPRFHIVLQIDAEDFVTQTPQDVGLDDREQHLHAAIEIARHQVRTPEIDLFLPSATEVDNPAVLEDPADNAGHANRLAHPGDPGTQAAHAANQQVDLHPGLGRAI